MELTLTQAVEILAEEMDLDLEMGKIHSIEPNAPGIQLYYQRKKEPYGAFVLILDREEAVRAASYLGQYPRLTGLKTQWGIIKNVSLDLDTRVIHPELDPRGPTELVRTDRYDVPFLGKRYDGWDKHQRHMKTRLDHSRASEYVAQILAMQKSS